MAHSWRGHPIELDGQTWIYSDTRRPVHQDPRRGCGECGLGNTPAGHDGCIGEVAGAVNACCGHGQGSEAYIHFADGSDLRGEAALRMMKSEQVLGEIARLTDMAGLDWQRVIVWMGDVARAALREDWATVNRLIAEANRR